MRVADAAVYGATGERAWCRVCIQALHGREPALGPLDTARFGVELLTESSRKGTPRLTRTVAEENWRA